MKTVLVVDDELAIAEALSDVLSDEGYRTLTAMNGRQGLEVALTARPDLILVDMMMPVLNGPGMIKELRATPLLAQTPVVAMSALSEPKGLREELGYQGFLHKPFDIESLLAVVEQLARSR